jgi:hypothetical protein
MPSPKPPASDPLSLTIKLLLPPFRVDRGWRVFRKKHASWLGRLTEGEPIYGLPKPVITALHTAGVLNEQDKAAENDLQQLCTQSKAIGFLDGECVAYDLLRLYLPPPSKELMQSAGWTRGQMFKAKKEIQEAERYFRRLRGIVGWLLTEPAFLQCCQNLKQQWRALSDEYRPRFPLQCGKFRLEQLQSATTELGWRAYDEFVSEFLAFCDRWGLIGMQTWDLPQPQGLLFPDLLPQGSPAWPRHGVHIIVPVCFPIHDSDDFIKQVNQQQRALAQQNGIDPSAAGLPHAEAYARILEIIHIENTIISRYGPATKTSGLVGIIIDAVATTLSLSTDQVQKWRKAVSACRRGHRDSVAAFKTRS